MAGHSKGTAADEAEEGGDDVKSVWPLCPGLHTRYNGWYNGLSDPVRGSESRKTTPSSDWGLQPDPMKTESLVIAYQHGAVNTFPGLVHTARHAMGAGGT